MTEGRPQSGRPSSAKPQPQSPQSGRARPQTARVGRPQLPTGNIGGGSINAGGGYWYVKVMPPAWLSPSGCGSKKGFYPVLLPLSHRYFLGKFSPGATLCCRITA
eukprot:8189880-Pyramimonas_sp.AAC.1